MSDISLDLDIKAVGIKSTVDSLKNLNKELDKTEKSNSGVSKSFKNVDDSTVKTTKSVDNLSNSFNNLIKNPLVQLVAGVTAVITAFKSSTQAIDTQIKAERNLTQALALSTKGLKGLEVEFANLASEIQSATPYGDEFTMQLFTMGANADLTKEQILTLSNVALDTMSATGSDAVDVMKDLILSTRDAGSVISVLEQNYISVNDAERKWLASLDESGDTIRATEFAVQKLSDIYSGKAKDSAETYAGSVVQIQNVLGDINEEFGRVSVSLATPITSGIADTLNVVYSFLREQSTIDAIINGITTLNVAFDVLSNTVSFAFGIIKDNIKTFIDGIVNITSYINMTSVSFESLLNVGADVFTTLVLYVKEAMSVFGKFGEMITQLQTGQFEELKKTASEVGDSFKKMIDPKGIYKEAQEVNKGLVGEFKKTRDEVAKNWNFGGEDGKLPSLLNVKGTKDDQDEVLKGFDKFKTEMQKKGNQISQSFSSIGGALQSITDATFSFRDTNTETFEEYDAQIQAINDKYDEYYEKRHEGEEQVDESSMKQLEYLNQEYKKQDELGKLAIQKKIDEIKAEQKKIDDEKKLKQKQADEDKKIETEKEKAIAMAEYQKAVAVHENEVANAQTKHEQVIADVAVSSTQGTLQAGLGFAKAIADLGPIAGPIVGSANMAGVIATVASGVAEVKSSASALAGLKGQAPKPPAFRFGTMGYELEEGGSAIVGEAGAEVITNNGGMLEVQSAYQTSQSGTGGGGDIINISINASQFTMSEIRDLLVDVLSSNEFRDRDFLFNN